MNIVTGRRATPPDTPGYPFVHEAVFYRDDAGYVSGVVPFIQDGLRCGEPVLVAVPAANVDLVRSALGPKAAQVRFVNMAEAGRNPGRIIPGVLHAFISAHAARHPRVVGEPIWAGRSVAEYPGCVQHEALINAAFAGIPASILCPYDAARLGRAVLADAARTHPVLVDGDRREASHEYAEPDAVVAAFNRPLPEPGVPPVSTTVDRDALGALRRLVAEFAASVGLHPARIADLQLAVNELATNSITHAGGSGTVRLWREDGHLVCEVRDKGRFTPRLAGRIPPPVSSEHGRGLLLVNHLCDLVQTYTGPDGTAVRLHLYP